MPVRIPLEKEERHLMGREIIDLLDPHSDETQAKTRRASSELIHRVTRGPSLGKVLENL